MPITAKAEDERCVLYGEPTVILSKHANTSIQGIPLGSEVTLKDATYHCLVAAPPDRAPYYSVPDGFANGVGVNAMPYPNNRYNLIGDRSYGPGDQVMPINGIIFEVT